MEQKSAPSVTSAFTRCLPLDKLQAAPGLKRVLGPGSLVALGVGATIGAGLFSLTGIAASENAGPAVVLSFFIAAIACGFAGLCYSELASMIPIAGSAYTYAYVTLGEMMAWIIGWDLVLEYAVGAATVAVSWSRYVVSLLDSWGIVLPPRLTTSPFETVQMPDGSMVSGLMNLPAVFITCLVSWILIRGISQSAMVNAVVVVIKLLVITAFIGFGIHYINPANYHPFIPQNTGTFGQYGWSGIMRAAGTIFFAYVGFDAVSTTAQETKNPARDMPIGILGSLLICALAYVCFSFVMTGLVNYKDMLGDAAPVATAINRTPYTWLQLAIKIGIICGFTSVLMGMLLGQSRVFFAMSRDGLLPPMFSATHPKYQTPWMSNVFFMLIICLLSAFLPISELGHMTSIGTLLAFILVCAGVMILRRKAPDHPRAFRVPGGDIIPILGILSCGTVMVSLDGLTWIRLVVWLAIGMVIYLTYGRYHSALARPSIPPDRVA
ncbi:MULTISPECIES: amino acid permease [Acetobacter]|uniref:Amino acid transporter n=7 Tax=Acetobacter TaxID=434 RepID=A0AAN1U8J1_9PROT|nr:MULTISPECIES: amino acid permease [Acetobacter]ANA14302.1 amino acid transporter [Acetobacter oryzifermentans]ASL40782.1 amino acid transporter [Acetobacter oryzifermentans]ATI12838.1 amino acid transporter [Acetobacter pomorum]AXC27032.1 amino acid permease [Acetobacter sp. JWB]AXM99872.1 amino acid transporter [Acetobacter pomorum]